jgi:peptidoglycan hydrolase-like protein with peptidoglycan-binding domain
MTVRSGMTGEVVARIEQFLLKLKLYRGPVDGCFGGGVEAAVKTYQTQQGLAPSGAVDSVTWSRMFPTDPPPVSEIASLPLAERCLALTGSFETGKFAPDCFCGIAGDFDQMGLSFGALQWNVGQGSLQPLLMQMFDQHADVARNIFHEHFDTVAALRTSTVPDQLTFARSIQTSGRLQEPWQGMLIALGRTPEFQGIQSDHASKIFQQALNMCGDYGLISERAVALMFDIATQGGSIPTIIRAQIMADFAQLPKTGADNEVAKMCIVANRRAAASNPKFVDDVRVRKLTIAQGTGTVHGLVYDLADTFNLTLNPFAQARAAVQ